VIGLLIVLRIVWRLTHTPPPLPAAMPAWQRHAARPATCPLPLHAGAAAVRVSGLEFQQAWHQVLQPRPLGRPGDRTTRTLYAFFNGAHHLAALLLALFVGLHVLAVAKHMLIDRDGLLLAHVAAARRSASTGAFRPSLEPR
jgi:cytochrome b561